MIYCFDIDGIICNDTFGDYQNSIPNVDIITKNNQLFDTGNVVKYFTARGSKTGIDWKDFTRAQLSAWGVKYHELIFSKPHAHVYIDDKALNSNVFFNESDSNSDSYRSLLERLNIKVMDLRSGESTKKHYRIYSDERIIVLSGQVTLVTDGTDEVLNRGEERLVRKLSEFHILSNNESQVLLISLKTINEDLFSK